MLTYLNLNVNAVHLKMIYRDKDFIKKERSLKRERRVFTPPYNLHHLHLSLQQEE